MRASSRLVLGWTSISLVAVAIGWAALDSVIDTETLEPAEVAALDPAVLSPSPSAPPQGTPTASPSTAPRPREAGRVVRPANRPAPEPTRPTPASPSLRPSQSPSPDPDATGEDGRRPPLPPSDQSPDEILRTVKSEGGTATVAYFDNHVYLVDYIPAPGYLAQGERIDAESIVVRFIGIEHLSTVHAYVDGDGLLQVKVIEEGG